MKLEEEEGSIRRMSGKHHRGRGRRNHRIHGGRITRGHAETISAWLGATSFAQPHASPGSPHRRLHEPCGALYIIRAIHDAAPTVCAFQVGCALLLDSTSQSLAYRSVALLQFVVFVGLGILVGCELGLTTVNSVFLLVQTLTTVGYGNLTDNSEIGRAHV